MITGISHPCLHRVGILRITKIIYVIGTFITNKSLNDRKIIQSNFHNGVHLTNKISEKRIFDNNFTKTPL